MPPNLQVRLVDGFKKTRLRVSSDDVTTAPYLAAEPFRDRAASPSYL